MVISLVGSNWFGVKQALTKLVDDFVVEHGELALERIEAGDVDYEHIIGAVESLPFLANKKMVILQDLSTNKVGAEALESIIEKAGDTTDLVIVESRIDKRSVYYKALKKLTGFREYNELDEAGLSSWLIDEAKAHGGEITKADAQYLVQRVGANQTGLSYEIQKLVQYAPKITRKSIDELTDENPASTIFNLLDMVFAGKLDQALKLYDEQRAQKVEPQAIHAMFVWQMHAVAVAASAPDGTSSADIARDAKMNPFVTGKSQGIAKRMGRAKILEFMELLRDIDYKSKHQTFDYDEALRYAIVSLAQ